MAAQPAPAARQAYVFTFSRFFMFIGALLFVLASLSVAFSWAAPAWAFGFGAFGAVCLAWAA